MYKESVTAAKHTGATDSLFYQETLTRLDNSMIQRIQTVYLLIVAILSVVMMFLPVGSFVGADYSVPPVEFTNLAVVAADGTANYAPWALFVLLVAIAVISAVTIFLYKKRMLQIRLTVFNCVLLVGYYATLITFVFMLKGDCRYVPSWIVCLPFVPAFRVARTELARYPCDRKRRNVGQGLRTFALIRFLVGFYSRTLKNII